MRLSHKIRKLLRSDGLQSAIEHIRRWSHPVDTAPMLRALDPSKLARLRQDYPEAKGPNAVGNSAKFADAKYWLKVNVERAQDLRLDQRPSEHILDLGCGAGYFLYVCQQLGHKATGLDIDENPLFRATIDLLGVKRVVGRIEANAPLPKFGQNFDLVTAHCICFQKLPSGGGGKRQEWDVEAWRFFLTDVRTNVLTRTGRLLLDFNPRGRGVYYPPEVGAFFRQEGGHLFRSKVIFPAEPQKAAK